MSGAVSGAHDLRSTGPGKFLADVISIFQLNAIPAIRHWYVTVLAAALIPVPWFYVTSTIAPEDPQVLRRLMAGTLVFGVTFLSACSWARTGWHNGSTAVSSC
ncbi:MAG: hypothetical protein OXP69_07400 [Spirochaetaceae bacterium]|nr:hypothetical protein [Spirochaetaceae bacterium]